jgi:hypothetical protein
MCHAGVIWPCAGNPCGQRPGNDCSDAAHALAAATAYATDSDAQCCGSKRNAGAVHAAPAVCHISSISCAAYSRRAAAERRRQANPSAERTDRKSKPKQISCGRQRRNWCSCNPIGTCRYTAPHLSEVWGSVCQGPSLLSLVSRRPVRE